MVRPKIPQNIAINVYWLGTSFMWNSIHPIVLPLLLLTYADTAKNTAYGVLTFVGLVIALVVQPLSGALSDRTNHPWGRRRPWILLGMLLSMACLAMLATATNFWVVAVGYALLQFSSNLAHGPAQGLIPDLVPPRQRGRAAGLKNLFDMLGIVVAAIVASRLMGGLDVSPWPIIAMIMLVLVMTTTITWRGAGAEAEQPVADLNRTTVGQQIRDLLSIKLRQHRDYSYLLLARYFMLLGSFSIQSFALFYFRDVLRIAAPARMVGDIMTAVGLSVLVVAYPAGILTERIGHKPLAVLGCLLASLGTGLLMFSREPLSFWILGALIGMGMGIFATVNWAWATDLVPAQAAGKYLGLSNLATAGSAATARLLGPLIDLINGYHPHAGYSLLFILATAGAVASLVVTLRISETRPPSSGFRWYPWPWLTGARPSDRKQLP